MRNTCSLLVSVLLSGSAFAAGVYYVDRDFQGENSSGTSWLSAFPSVQGAIDAATAAGGGEIWVKAGVYTPPGTDRTASFILAPGIHLYGGFRGNETERTEANPNANRTVLSGDIGQISSLKDNCIHVITGAAQSGIHGFIVTGGHANGLKQSDSGGGLRLGPAAKNFSVINCTFEKNYGTYGGALYSAAAGTIVSNCTFFANSAVEGGAVALGPGAHLKVMHSSFASNYAQQAGGAAILTDQTSAVFIQSWFLKNSTDGSGGALASIAKQKNGIRLQLMDCTLNQNTAQETGGALFNKGPFSPEITRAQFAKNTAVNGAGVMSNQNGTRAIWKENTLTRNRSAKGIKDIENDDRSLLADETATASQKQPDPPAVSVKPAPINKRKLADVYIVNSSGVNIKLRSIVANGDYTVIALGDLTDPIFLSNYRNLEAAAKDYHSPTVNFLYIYRYLAHPENHGYVSPFILAERKRHTQLAQQLLKTRIPWVYDTMQNTTAQTLGLNEKTLFIYNKNGVEEYAGTLMDTAALRTVLARLAGPVAAPTALNTLPRSDLGPLHLPISKLTPRIKINPNKTQYRALQITPVNSRQPFYVKMRVEASKQLLATGNGKLYLGFHIDPLYNTKWNNLGDPLHYAMEVPAGTAISPSINQAAKVKQKINDAEPREFLLEARKWKSSQPVKLTVKYTVYIPSSKRNSTVIQKYLIYLNPDPFGGQVIGRNITEQAALKTETTTRSAQNAYQNLINQSDSNKDGMLSRNEAPRDLLRQWRRIDQNRDGKIDRNEYDRYRENETP